jgi:hypothetical protein
MEFQTTLVIKHSNVTSTEIDESLSNKARNEITAIKIFLNKFLLDNDILIEDGKIIIDFNDKKPTEIGCIDIQSPYANQITKILMDHLEKRR